MKNDTDHGRAVCSNVTAAKINQKSQLADYLENYEPQEWLPNTDAGARPTGK